MVEILLVPTHTANVKIFAWRVLHDALPVATSLVRRKIITDSTCSICRQSWESTRHALFSCKYAKAVWRSQNFSFNWHACTSMRSGDYLLHLSTTYTKFEMEQIFCTMWAIWTERNKVVHGSTARSAQNLATFASVWLQNYRAAQQHHASTASTSAAPHQQPQATTTSTSAPAASHQQRAQTQSQSWSPPTPGGFKLNVDVAVNPSMNTTGVGAVIRDSNGHVVAAMSMPIVGNFKFHEMEGKALFHSLNWAIQQQLPVTQVETDALMVTNALTAPFNPNSSFSDLIVDVISLLFFFPNVRSANEAAYGLAKFALGVDETCSWLEYFPSSTLNFTPKSKP
ncbi:uncharacterized protein LOC133039759 [Cannabis sativa]|uniref:uncharacterized protein LOC133039759 n=1 Tax=Cannabis sativa TaxID=3483 RepID=UPI0029CA0F07|nr:uncharacterized protein LOC133039759 [Cannabis sativa]